MINKVLNTINKYDMIHKNDNIILGLSGGSDSVTLFHILRLLKDEYNLKLIVVHINHGLREEAVQDENFCINLCNKYEIPIYVYKTDINKLSKERKITTEEAGRFFRYECFNKHVKNGNEKIAVAHNKNDVVETFFMRAVRGSGLRGLSSIQPVRENIIRPLIEVEKDEIENYCAGNNFEFIFDKSNLSKEYTRNKIRLNLIPLLKKEYNTEIINNVYKTSKILSEEEAFLNELSKKYFEDISFVEGSKIYLNIEKFKNINLVMQRRVLMEGIFLLNKDMKNLSYAHIEQSLNLINMENGSSFNLPQNIKIIKQYENLCIKNSMNDADEINKSLKINKIYYVEQKKLYLGISSYKIESYKNYENSHIVKDKQLKCIKENSILLYNYNNLVLRNRIASDKIYFRHINGNKKLKKYFIDEKIPRDDRNNILLLAQNNNVFLVLDEHLKMADSLEGNNTLYLKIWEEN